MNRKEQEIQFDKILAIHGDGIYRICKSYLYEDGLVQDLYQEVLLNIWKSIPTFKKKSSLKTWAFRIAINTTISFNHYQSRRRQKQKDFENETMIKEDSDSGNMDQLHHAIQQLDSNDKRLIGLFLEGFSYKEMADITGWTTNHVGVKINRIKSRLKAIIESS